MHRSGPDRWERLWRSFSLAVVLLGAPWEGIAVCGRFALSSDCVISSSAVPWVCPGSPKGTSSLFLRSTAVFSLRAISMDCRVSLKRREKGVRDSNPLLPRFGLPVSDSKKSSECSPESFPPFVEASEAAWGSVCSAGGACPAGVVAVAGTMVLCRWARLACSSRSLVVGIWPPPASRFRDFDRPLTRDAGLRVYCLFRTASCNVLSQRGMARRGAFNEITACSRSSFD